MTDRHERKAYTNGLRALAKIIDNNPNIELPFEGSNDNTLKWIPVNNDAETQVNAIMEAVGGKWDVSPIDSVGLLKIETMIDGLHVAILINESQLVTPSYAGTFA